MLFFYAASSQDFLTYEVCPSGPPPVMSVMANTSVVAVVSHSSITVLNAATLEPLANIADCLAYTDPNRGWYGTSTTVFITPCCTR